MFRIYVNRIMTRSLHKAISIANIPYKMSIHSSYQKVLLFSKNTHIILNNLRN